MPDKYFNEHIKIYMNIILMSEFTVGVLKPKKYTFDNVSKMSEYQDTLSNDIKLHKITPAYLMEFVVNSISLTPTMMGASTEIYQDENIVYQFCHLDASNPTLNKNEDNINSIAGYLSIAKEDVYGTCIILKNIIQEDKTCKNGNIDLDELKLILRKKFFHTGICLKADQTFKTFEFNTHPVQEFYNNERANNFRYVEFKLLKWTLILFVEKEPQNDELNMIASKFDEKFIIRGDILICAKINDKEYYDLDEETMKMIIEVCLCETDLKNLELAEKEPVKINGIPTVLNAPIILRDRYKKALEINKNQLENITEEDIEKLKNSESLNSKL